jgi:hypothetical protein
LTDEIAEVSEELLEGDTSVEAPEEAAETNTSTEAKEPNTLLSDDEGNGEEGGVPEKYEYAPTEGYEVTPDVQVALDEFSGIAKEASLTQAQYQSLVQWQVEKGVAGVDDFHAQYTERVQGWADTAKTDAEIGGESFKDNLTVANQAVEQFSTAGLKSILAKPSTDNPDGLGIGNHPELVRLFYRIGKAMGDSSLTVGGASESYGDPLQRMYPSMYPEKSN